MYLQKKIETLTVIGLVSRHINRHLKIIIACLVIYKNTNKSCDFVAFISCDAEIHADNLHPYSIFYCGDIVK